MRALAGEQVTMDVGYSGKRPFKLDRTRQHGDLRAAPPLITADPSIEGG